MKIIKILVFKLTLISIQDRMLGSNFQKFHCIRGMIFGVGVSIDPKLDLIILGIMFDIANFTDSGQRDNKYVF